MHYHIFGTAISPPRRSLRISAESPFNNITTSAMLGIPRSARLVLIVLAVVVLPSIYILYPHHDIPQAPGSRVEAYEAGGIDSEHWRDPVRPDFENEEARWSAEESVLDSSSPPYVESDKTWLNHGMVNQPFDDGLPDEKVIGGGVIMPKLGNATAKWVLRQICGNELNGRAELGRAAWHVLHLMTLRYPDVNPNPAHSTGIGLISRNPQKTIDKRSNRISTCSRGYTPVENAPRSFKYCSRSTRHR